MISKGANQDKKNETRLHRIWGTGSLDFTDFDMGVGLNFFLLKALALIMPVPGCINIPRMLYYSSKDYVDNAPASIFKTALKGEKCTCVMAGVVFYQFFCQVAIFPIIFS